MVKKKKLVKSSENKIIFGVCGGLGEYFEIDPILFRLSFIILTFAGGGGILIYLLFALVMPSSEK
ncbi:PspC domain-containing protein [Patescibacteria group bacterium]|nr:PspC domain-containing protein [Patescibacteria group bacterium]